MTEHHPSKPSTFAEEILAATGLDVADCYQCGKCSAGCPMAGEMPIGPHSLIRLVQLNRRAKALSSESVWLCLTCETCTTRCPNGFDPAGLIDGLREIAVCGQVKAPRKIRALHQSFLDQMRIYGRVGELFAIADYKMRSLALFDDVAAAPGMLSRGKLEFLPHKIKGIQEIRRIFNACLDNQEEK